MLVEQRTVFRSSEDETQAISLGWQALLPTEPSYPPLDFVLLYAAVKTSHEKNE